MGPRFSGFDVLKIDDLTHLEILSRESLVELLNFYRQHAPGFENAWIMLTGFGNRAGTAVASKVTA